MHVVIGLYDGIDKAQQAVTEMVKAGASRQDVQVTTHRFISTSRTSHDQQPDNHIFRLLNAKYPDGDVGSYTDEVIRGGTVVTLEVSSDRLAEKVESIMKSCGAASVEKRTNEQREII